MMLISLMLIIASYLLGSVSFAVIVSKAMGEKDPRSYGSGNPGATNVLRSGNKKAAAFTLLGDALKGTIAVLLAKLLAEPLGFGNVTVAAVALAVFVGHLFPVFFGFKGGKGVATAFGVLLAISWPAALISLCVWLGVAFGLKVSSLAALVSAVFSPILAWIFLTPGILVLSIVIMVVILIARHHQNIRQLLEGSEGKIGEKAEYFDEE